MRRTRSTNVLRVLFPCETFALRKSVGPLEASPRTDAGDIQRRCGSRTARGWNCRTRSRATCVDPPESLMRGSNPTIEAVPTLGNASICFLRPYMDTPRCSRELVPSDPQTSSPASRVLSLTECGVHRSHRFSQINHRHRLRPRAVGGPSPFGICADL